MGRSKTTKEPNEKKMYSITYQRTKVLKSGTPKNDRVEKT
jgi:hypothetical protein